MNVSAAHTKTDKADAPFLELDLARVRAGLRCDELLEVSDGVVGAALDADCMHRDRGPRGRSGRQSVVGEGRGRDLESEQVGGNIGE